MLNVFTFLVVFTVSLVLLDFIFSLRKLQILKKVSLLALAKSAYYSRLKLGPRQIRKTSPGGYLG